MRRVHRRLVPLVLALIAAPAAAEPSRAALAAAPAAPVDGEATCPAAAQRLLFRHAAHDDRARAFADDLAAGFRAAGWAADVEPQDPGADSAVRFRWTQDADAASLAAAMRPVLAGRAEAAPLDPATAPGLVEVSLVGGPEPEPSAKPHRAGLEGAPHFP